MQASLTRLSPLDKVGNRNSKADNAGTANYTYDVLNRLTNAVNPLPTNPLETFNYDPVGNRTTSNQNGASTFNQANHLTEDANFTYQFDANGNQTRKTNKATSAFTTYEYDAENKLVRVVSNGTTSNYKYDGLGRRVEKEIIAVSTTVTRYVYDNEDILLELDGSNNITARYTHGPGIDEPLIMEKAGASFFYHADGLGSITELTNQSGAVTQRYTYSSFGKIESQLDPNFVQLYSFTSREFDIEIGSYFYRARNYDGASGRFLTSDPIGLAGGLNLYIYAESNPLRFTDPTGLDVYMCTKPLHALGSVGEWVYKIGVPLLYHQYVCVKNGQTTVCGGQDRARGPYSPGKPSDDTLNLNTCKKQTDSPCMETCLVQAIQNRERPYYGLIGPGTNCQEWANDVYSKCLSQCSGLEY